MSINILGIHSLLLPILLLAVVLVSYRLVKGPGAVDRVLALDTLSNLAIVAIFFFAVVNNEPLYLDLALAFALLGFVATVAFARFIDQSTLAPPPTHSGLNKVAIPEDQAVTDYEFDKNGE